MKKTYLIVLLLVANLVSSAQITLPYTYGFSGGANFFYSIGWGFLTNDDDCDNFIYGGEQLNEMWFVSMEPCGPDYRQYLITPRFANNTDDSVQVRFRYIIPEGMTSQDPFETFVVGYCTADGYSSAEDFIWLGDTVTCTNTDSWLMYQHNVPANAQYVSIAYTSGESYALYIDDFLIRADSPDAVYTFTINADDGGTFSVTTNGVTTSNPTTTVHEGDEVSYTITANPGCSIDSLHINGTPYYFDTYTTQTTFTQTIFPVLSDYVIDVFFGHFTYRIQVAETEHGHIVPDGGDSHELIVPWDTTITFRFYPDEGYHISSVSLTTSGITYNYYDCPDTLTLAHIRQNYILRVAFALNDYVVSVTSGEGGAISPSGEVNVQGLSSPQFLISANPGYLIDTVYVDGTPLDLPHTRTYLHTFNNITDNHTLSATFLHQPYIVHYTHGPHGTITAQGGIPAGTDSLLIYYEDTIVFHFDIEEGYELSDLQLNETSLEISNPYLLTHVTENSLFHAAFAEKNFHVTASVNGAGIVSPNQSGTVGYFDTVQFVFTPGYCMQTDSILLDGSPIVVSDTVLLTHLEGSHNLIAYFSQKHYSIEILPCAHGSIIGAQDVVCGGTSRLKLVPDHCYRFTHFYLDGADRIDLLSIVGDTIWANIASVNADHVVTAEFERITYNVAVTSNGQGSISPDIVGEVLCDTTIDFEIIPDECHYVESVTVNSESAESLIHRYPCAESGFGDTLRFELTQIEQDQTVIVTFRQFDYPLSLTAGEHGTLSATGNPMLPCGTDTVIAITPDECYEIASVLVDGADVTSQLQYNGASASYSFINIHEPHTLEASFARQTHTAGIAPTTHGSISPDNDSIVLCGNGLTYTIVPDECYQIDSVWLDGSAINSQLTYRPNANNTIGDSAIFVLSGITEDHVVSASFKLIRYTMRAMAFGNGAVSLSLPGNSIECGDSITLTMVPNDCHYIKEVWYNNQRITDYQLDDNGIGTFKIYDVTEDVHLSVIYEKIHYSLSLAQPTQHGSIDYLPEERSCGEMVTISYQADDCYHLDSVMVGDEWIPVSELLEEEGTFVYLIQDLRSDILLDAVFSIDSIHYVSREGATLSVTDSVLACGQDLTVFSVREDCKQLDSIRINGTIYLPEDIDGHLMSLNGDTLYIRFENLHEDQDLAVFYSHIQYLMNIRTVGRGRVSEPASQLVACGDSIAIAIFPNDCQHFDHLIINDSEYPMDNDTMLVIRNMRENLDLTFYFSSDIYEMTVQYNELGICHGLSGPIPCGRDLSYSFKALECAMLDSVFLDGVCMNDELVYTSLPTLFIDSISSDHTLVAVFKKIPYEVVIETDSFNFVSAEQVNIVECGEDFHVAITPDQCHFISDILLNGHSAISELEEQDGSYLFTISHVRRDFHLEILFSKHTLSITTALVDSEGQLLSQEEADIICGSDTTLNIAPYNECYSIDSVYLNGTNAPVQTSYLLQDIEGEVTLTAFMHKIGYTIAVLPHGHFTMTEGELLQTLSCGDTLHLGFAPEEGYHLSGMVVDGDTLPASNHYVFEDIHTNHTITAITELNEYKVVTTTNEWGSASPDSVMASHGSDVTIQLIPSNCHEIQTVTVDGTNYSDSLLLHDDYAELTIHSLTSDKAVVAEFGRIEYSCNVSGSEGGEVLPSSSTLLCSDTLSVAMIPTDCYHVASVQVNGDSIPLEQLQQSGSEMRYRVEEVLMDYNIDVQFERNSYTITVENHGTGTVETTSDHVSCGEGFSFYIAPAQCTHLESVLLNGEDITAHLTYRDNANPWLADTACFTATNITENQTLEVFYTNDGERNIDITYLSGTNVLRHGTVAITCGSDTALPIFFDCYTIDSMFVDGVQMPTNDTCHFTEVIADHTVQVMCSRTQYQISAESPVHGTLTPAGVTEVSCGTNKTYTITPEQGYYIDSLIVDNIPVTPAPSYVFEDVRQNHTISVVFAQYSYLIDVEVSGNGAITPDDTNVWHGDAVHFAILPDDCHTIDSVVVDNVNLGAIEEYDFASVTGAHTLHGYFSRAEYSITEGVSENGTITFNATEIACGGEVPFTVSPNECYQLDSVLVNGENRGAVFSDTIRDIRQDQVIDAYFSPIVYQVVVDESTEHGTITLEDTEVRCGESVSLTIQPNSCYSVDSVLINGENVGSVTTHTITNITGNQLVKAYFSMNEYNVEVIASEHGTVTHTGMNVVQCGDTFAIEITPDNCYEIGAVRVDGVWSNRLLQGNRLILDDITENHVISVNFELRRYYQYTSCNLGGSISPAFMEAACGSEEVFSIHPINCYRVDSIWINDIYLPNDSLTFNGDNATLTLRDIQQSNTIRVKFTGISYQFEVENNGDGIINLEQNSIDCDGEATFYILPSQCDRISSAILNGNDITSLLNYHENSNPLMPDTAFYTIPRTNTNQLLQINYQHLDDNHVSIIYTDGTDNLYAADSMLACGESLALSFGYECYTVDSVLVNGENAGAVPSVTLPSNLSDQTVTAYFSQNRYTVITEVTEGGNIALDGDSEVACGGNAACTITQEECYSIDSVIVNGDNKGAITSYLFENIIENQNIKAYFSRNEFTISVRTEGDGQITLDSSATVLCGDNRSCVMVPAECSSIDSVVVNGENKGSITSYLFENIIENQEITAYFTLNAYQFVASAETGGQIVPSDTTTVACGSQQTYSILHEECYSIDSVVVNGINVGAVNTYTLYCTDEQENQTIHAFFSQKKYNVQLMAGEGGTITPDGDTLVLCGEDLAIAITPDECYNIESMLLDGSDMGSVSSYILENITGTHTVSATFVQKEFDLTPLASTGGSISPNVTTTVACDSGFTFNFEPNEGYYISAIVVDSDTLEAANYYTFENVRGNHTVKPVFERKRYAITATASEGGMVSPEYSIVEHYGRQTITITADDCYHIDSIFADGDYVGSYPTYTFNNVTDSHTLAATFAINEYTVTASVIEGNGTITPDGDTVVACGGNATYSITPETGWHISSLLVDSEPVEISDTYTFADIRRSHTISVQFAINDYMVTATAGEGGSVSPTLSEASFGEDVTVRISADECHHIDSVFADSSYVGAVESYTFENVTGNHTLTATFAMNVYEIAAAAGEHGSITPADTTTVNCGENVTYSIVPEAGWHISSLLVDGEVIEITDTYTFTDVRGDHTISAQFAIDEFSVTATAGEGGSVTPTDTTVAYNESVTVEITADDCYHIDSVFVDSSYVGAVESYTFENVTGNHTLTATFAMNVYEIAAAAGEHGSITPADTTTVNCGESVSYSIVPETGWHISSLLVDGEAIEISGTYTFTDVRGGHTISAQFAIDEFTVTSTAGEGGSVTPTDTTVSYNEPVTVEITADDCYHIDSVFADGSYVGAVESYTFENVDSNHTLSATFAINKYEIAAAVIEGNGTILPNGNTLLSCGEDITYSIVPETGWHISSLLVDDEAIEISDTYTFTNVRDGHTISVQFAIDEFTVTATAGEGGSVTPTFAEASFGESITVEITADDCYHIDSVFADGSYVGAVESYSFENVDSNHTLTATFAMDMYEISAVAGLHGSITPADTMVACGENATCSIIPEAGWHITSLLVDGEPVNVTTSYTFTDVRENHTISAQFAINEFTVTATAGVGGSVTPTLAEASFGESITVEITAEDCYYIDSVIVDGTYIGSVPSYTFSNISEDHTLTATFAISEYTIAVLPAPEHGTITPPDMTPVYCGDSVHYDIIPDEGYHVTELIVDRVSIDPAETYVFTDVHSNHLISASFAINEFTVTATAGEGGSVTPTDTTVAYNESVTVAITADDCYDIESVTVDGVEMGAVPSFLFEHVTANHTVSATFIQREFMLTPLTSTGGNITPGETDIVACGSDYTYHITPDEGYSISGIVVDGDTLPADTSFRFENIRRNHTIKALFTINEFTVTAPAGEGGSVTPTDTTVAYNESVTVAITADDCYHIDSVIVNGANMGAVTSYELSNITENQVVEAFFSMSHYNIFIAVSNEDELLLFDTIRNMACGSDTLVTVPSFDCYYVDSITINGVITENVDAIRIEDIHEDKEIIFYMSREQFVIVVTKEGNGTVNPFDTVHIPCDSVLTFTFTPDEGWYVEDLIIDGVSLGTPTENHYAFLNINANHTLHVVFAPTVFIITSSIDPIDAGNITPYGQTPVNYGDDQTFNISPFPGYQVIDVEVDGVSQGAITTYTFHNVTANHTIVAHLQTVGVEESAINEDVVLWPNPVENICHIQLPSMRNMELQLFDAQGKLILRKHIETDEAEIDLTERPSGMYLLRVVSDGKVVATRKVIRK